VDCDFWAFSRRQWYWYQTHDVDEKRWCWYSHNPTSERKQIVSQTVNKSVDYTINTKSSKCRKHFITLGSGILFTLTTCYLIRLCFAVRVWEWEWPNGTSMGVWIITLKLKMGLRTWTWLHGNWSEWECKNPFLVIASRNYFTGILSALIKRPTSDKKIVIWLC